MAITPSLSKKQALSIVRMVNTLWILSTELNHVERDPEIVVQLAEDLLTDTDEYSVLFWVQIPANDIRKYDGTVIQSGFGIKELTALANDFLIQMAIEQDGVEVYSGLLNDLVD